VAVVWLGATAVFGVAPADAADAYDSRIVGLPERFQVGGEPGVMTVEVTRRAAGCTRIRALMLLTIQGIDYGHLKVEVKTGSGWENSPISRAGDHIMRAEDNYVDVAMLCEGQSRRLQHRIAFLRGAPTGTVQIDAVVSSHGSTTEAGRAKAGRPVVAGAVAAPTSARPRVSSAAASGVPSRAVSPAAAADPVTAGSSPAPVVAGPDEPVRAGPRTVSDTALWAGGAAVAVLGAAGLASLLLVARRRRTAGSQEDHFTASL
jgi:hypothetical protein